MPTRQIRTEGDVARVPLTQGYWAVIDAADVPLVEAWDWSAWVKRRTDGSIRAVYACRTERKDGKNRSVSMHRVLCPAPGSATVDHADGDGLNNRRGNLRPATHGGNSMNRRIDRRNRSGVKGVHWDARDKRWRARIWAGGRLRNLGYFSDLQEAGAAYARASAELHGAFGRVA